MARSGQPSGGPRDARPELFNTPGPRPGNARATTQRKAIADGYPMAPTERSVEMSQPRSNTGGVMAPGITGRAIHTGDK